MRKTARAAARQHQSHPTAHQQASDPAVVGGFDNVMVQPDGERFQPRGAGAGIDAALMHQRQFDSRTAGQGRLDDAGRPGHDAAAGRRRHENHIGLAATLASPTGGGPICHIYDIVVDLFDAVEPGRCVGGGARIPDQFGTTRLAQFIDQARCQVGRVELDAVGNQHKDVRPLRSVFLTVAVPEPPRAEAGERQRKMCGARRNALHFRVRDQQQLAVPQCNNGGATRRFQQPSSLADQFAALDLSSQPVL